MSEDKELYKLVSPIYDMLSMREEPFTSMVRQYGPQIGYGRMMQIVSHIWHEKDPVGALVVGPCYKQVEVYGEYFDLVDQLQSTQQEIGILTAKLEVAEDGWDTSLSMLNKIKQQLNDAQQEIERLKEERDQLFSDRNNAEMNLSHMTNLFETAVETLKKIHAYDSEMLDGVAVVLYYEIKRNARDTLHQLGVSIDD